MQSLFERMTMEADIIVTIAIMLMSGFAMTRITKKLKLPNVTAYIVAGILIGPYVFKLVPIEVIQGMNFLSDIALAFIAFSVGEFFEFSVLKKNGLKVVIITLLEALTASLLVFIVMFFVLKLNLAFSIVLAALASATAPASTMMTIRQTEAKGDFVDTLLQVVALDDIVGLVAYSIAISVATAVLAGGTAIQIASIMKPIFINIAVLILGGICGLFLKILLPERRTTDNRLIIAIALLFAFCGVCTTLDISPLLGCMSMGMIYINLAKDDRIFKQVNYFSPPILLLFFVKSGVGFRLDTLVNSSTVVGTTPLIAIGVIYFLVRIVGKYLGAFLGCAIAKKGKLVRNYLGLALIPQAGVAIGLAALGARVLGGEVGIALETIILASSVLYELIGPACAKLSLYLSKSYSEKLEDLITAEQFNENGQIRNDVDLLIERIQKIQEEIPKHQTLLEENEQAFMEGFEEQRMGYNRNYHRFRRR